MDTTSHDSPFTFHPPVLPRSVLITIAVGLALIAIIATVVTSSLLPKNPADTTPQLLTVQAGDSIHEVAQELEERELIRSALALRLLARFTGTDIKTGLFHISSADAPSTILSLLKEGTVSEVKVTLLEGWRTEEIATRLTELELVTSAQDFEEAAIVSENTPEWLVTEYSLTLGDPLEGFLFPDTYRVAADATPATIVNRLLDNFRSRTKDLDLEYADVTLASIVEREALFEEDRAGVAGVYANRLEIGMKLDADPTVQYAKAFKNLATVGDTCEVGPTDVGISSEVKETVPSSECNYWPQISVADYQSVNSPYNTYRVNGLPPTPISNPGLASLQAAAKPLDHNFFYFLHDAEGKTHYAQDAAQHTRNKAQFLR